MTLEASKHCNHAGLADGAHIIHSPYCTDAKITSKLVETVIGGSTYPTWLHTFRCSS